MLCPCGSQIEYSECCEPFIAGVRPAPTAEALMRSRYTAHVLVQVPYIKDTLAPEVRRDFDEASVRKWATEAEWLGLQIITPSEKASESTVEFIAKYKVEGKVMDHHEVAHFRKDAEQNRWYFVDGDAHTHEDGKGHEQHEPAVPFVRSQPKVGRNDPCSCGSGKKYKKCCGQ